MTTEIQEVLFNNLHRERTEVEKFIKFIIPYLSGSFFILKRSREQAEFELGYMKKGL